MKLINISTPAHPNTFTMVDDDDYEWLNQWKWCVDIRGYARRNQRVGENYKTILMHREIIQPPPGMKGDHRNGNRLDNRRENLRVCTHTENMRNRKPTAGRTLPKGVCWKVKRRRFRAQIHVNNRCITIGYFRTVPEAESAYTEASKKYYGEFRFEGSQPHAD